jgi:hypothetical protein
MLITSNAIAYAKPLAQTNRAITTASLSSACPTFPQTLDLMKASASQLAAYRLPPRPDNDPSQLASWQMRVQRLKHNHCAQFAPASSQHPFLSHPLQAPGGGQATGAFGSITSGNWSGYIAYDNGGITDVKGHWNIQCLGSQQQSGAREGSWIGIGGVQGSQNLIQTGSAYTKSGYQFFIEFVPYYAPVFDGSNYACGTAVDAEVYLASGYNEWCTIISTSTTSFSGCDPSSRQADKTTAEWIDERPNCSNGLSKLADFNYTQYSNAYAYSTSRGWHTIGGFTNNSVTLKDSASTTLAQPNALDSGTHSFTNVWKATGNGVACANL